MSNICSNCNVENESQAKFCRSCGQELTTRKHQSSHNKNTEEYQSDTKALSFSEFFFSANGRISRIEFFSRGFLPLTIILILIITIQQTLNSQILLGSINISLDFVNITALLLSIIISFMSAVVSIKRFHDFNYNGWTYLWMFIPLINFIVLLILMFKNKVDLDNRFGKTNHYEMSKVKWWMFVFKVILLFITLMALSMSRLALDYSIRNPSVITPELLNTKVNKEKTSQETNRKINLEDEIEQSNDIYNPKKNVVKSLKCKNLLIDIIGDDNSYGNDDTLLLSNGKSINFNDIQEIDGDLYRSSIECTNFKGNEYLQLTVGYGTSGDKLIVFELDSLKVVSHIAEQISEKENQRRETQRVFNDAITITVENKEYMVDKYPSFFLDNMFFKKKFINLMGDDYYKLKENIITAAPIKEVKNYYVGSGMARHGGRTEEAIFTIDKSTGNIVSAILTTPYPDYNREIRYYGVKGEKPFPIIEWVNKLNN